MTPALRLFVAIDPPAEARAVLQVLPERLRGVAWTPPDQYHLTLRFIGATPAADLERIEQALRGVRVEPFTLPLAGVGVFPPNRPPRVIWAGTGAGHPRLHQLRQRVDDALLAAGLATLDVRTFHPHVTLGRCGPECVPAAVSGFLKKHRSFEGPSFRVERFTLYASTLQPGGAVHDALLEVRLAPTPIPARTDSEPPSSPSARA